MLTQIGPQKWIDEDQRKQRGIPIYVPPAKAASPAKAPRPVAAQPKPTPAKPESKAPTMPRSKTQQPRTISGGYARRLG